MNNTIDVTSSREYFDHRQQQLKKKYETQKKGEKSSRYETRKGYFWDAAMKEQLNKPAPSKKSIKTDIYTVEKNLLTKSVSSLEKKVDRSLSKHSFLDSIEIDSKRYPIPSPNQYDLTEKSKIHKTIDDKQARKRMFMHQTQALSDAVPGPGAYNPHVMRQLKQQIKKKVHLSPKNPEQYRQIHKKQQQKEKKKHSKDLSPVTYNPLPDGTFQNISHRKKNQSVRCWGKGQRFPYDIKQLSKVRMPNPLPGRYNLGIEWKHEKKKKNWHQLLYKGHESSVYN